jgi:hypothetical protein
MNRYRQGCAFAFVLAIGLCVPPAHAADPAPQSLGSVTTIYIASLGEGDVSHRIRVAICGSLCRTGKVKIVESPREADATLAGIATQTHSKYLGDIQFRDGVRIEEREWIEEYGVGIAVHLIGKSHRVIWCGDVRPCYAPSWSSMLTRETDQMSEMLAAAIEKDRASHAPNLAAARSIYVAPLGRDNDSGIIREKLIGKLLESGKFSVLDSAAGADATVDGGASVTSHQSSYTVDLRLRAQVASNRATLKIEVQREHSQVWTAASRAADRAVKELIQACERDKAN